MKNQTILLVAALPGVALAEVFTDGHFDISAEYLEAEMELEPNIHREAAEGFSEGEFSPAGNSFLLGPASEFTLPAGSPFGSGSAFLAPDSSTQSDAFQVAFIGFGFEEIFEEWDSGALTIADDSISVALEGLSGPGDVFLYSGSAASPSPIIWDSSDGFGDSFAIDFNDEDHVHYNILFTEPGSYGLDIEMSATINGNAVSGSDTYTFTAVPEPSTYALIAGALALAFCCWRRRG